MLRPAGATAGGVMLEQAVMFQGAEMLPGAAERDRQLGGDLLGRGLTPPLDELEDAAPALWQTG